MIRCLVFAFVFCTTLHAQQPGCLAQSEWHKLGIGKWTLGKFEHTTDDLFLPAPSVDALDGKIDKTIDVAGLNAGMSELKRIYHAHGYFKVTISACARIEEPVEQRVLALVLDVKLGERAYIRRIAFEGAKQISHKELESVMRSQRPSALSYLLSTLGYGAPQLEEDKTRLVDFYHRRGFLDARVIGVRVQTSGDLSFCDITVLIDEGKLYRVGKIEPHDWLKTVPLRSGDVFDLTSLTDDVETSLSPFKDQGFAFAKATPDLTIDKDRLSVNYKLEKGERVMIRSVLARGNILSVDDVVTLEFLDLEGKPYNYSQVELRRLRLLKKGAFSNAKTTLLPTGTPGIYDLSVRVQEKFPMRFNLAPYFISGEGFLISAYVLHQNLFGHGVYGFIATQLSALRQAFELAFYEPHLGRQNVSWLMEVHDRQFQYYSFLSFALGGGGRLNFKANDQFTFGMGFNIDDVTATSTPPVSALTPYAVLPNANTRSAVYVTASVQPLAPSLDQDQQLILDARVTYSGIATLSEFNFAEILAGIRWGVTLKPFVLRGRLTGGWIGRLGDALLPITERYFLGGQSSLRGYQIFSVGPFVPATDSVPAIQIGGVKKIQQTIEVEFPLMKFLEMKGYLFTDMGNTYSETQGLFEGGLALSLGLGLTLTAWGLPLKCEVAKPLVDMPGALPLDFYIGLSSVNW